MSTTMTIRLESKLKQRLDQLAKITDRSKSYLAAEAIRTARARCVTLRIRHSQEAVPCEH